MVNVRGIEPSGGALQSTSQGTAQGKQNQRVIKRTEAKKSEREESRGQRTMESRRSSLFTILARLSLRSSRFARVISAP